MLSTSGLEMTLSIGTLVKRAIFSLASFGRAFVPLHYDEVGLDTDAPQLLDAVLGRLCLHLADDVDLRGERDVDEVGVLESVLEPHLPERLDERLALDVSHSPAALDDDDLAPSSFAATLPDPPLDLVRDVRYDLDALAEVLPLPLVLYDLPVDLPSGDVVLLAQVLTFRNLS